MNGETPLYGRLVSDDGAKVVVAATCPECFDEDTHTARHGETIKPDCRECGHSLRMVF